MTRAGSGPALERTVIWPPLSDQGIEIAEPWTGGLISPRPQLADIDGDGDLDLLLALDGGITHYRNAGNPSTFDFRFATDNLQGIDAGTWATLADIDADGDLDLFTDGSGWVALHRNDGTAQNPDWVLVDPMFQGIQNAGFGNTPVFADVDDDNDLDYLEMVQAVGTAVLYRNNGSAGVPLFEFETDQFGCIDTFAGDLMGSSGSPAAPGPIHGPPAQPGGHGISVISATDIDADSDLDIFIGDAFNPNLWFFRNDPGPEICYSRVTADYLPVSTAGLNQARFGDLDGDLDLDIVLGVVSGTELDNLLHFENAGTPAGAQFELRTLNLIEAFDIGFGAVPAAGDLDGDGDPDLFVGEQDGIIHQLINVGSATVPAFEVRDLLRNDAGDAIDPSLAAAPDLIDYDGDGDLDLFVGDGPGWVHFYRNDGTPTSPALHEVDAQFTGVKADFNAVPALGDLDDDGDLDLLVGEFGISLNPRLFFMRNDGTTESPVWVQVSDNTSGTFVFAERVYSRSLAPELADVDGDADLDLLLGEGDGNVNYYRNDGTPQGFQFVLLDEEYAGTSVGLQSAPSLVDLDGDTDLDLWLGEKNGGLNVFRSLIVPPIGVPDTPSADPPPGVTRLLGARPNPFAVGTTIRFTIGERGPVRLRIVDVAGRLVRTLIDGRVLGPEAGTFAVTWNGRDDAGREVGSGVFFYQLRAPAHASSRKLVILE